MDYLQSVTYIDDLAKFGSNLGLSRIRRLLELLGNPERKLRVIHVAGTNGKGSVTIMLGSILQSGGYRVGTYTSPHFVRYTERIQVCGKEIAANDFAAGVSAIKNLIESKNDLLADPPTQFEVLTALALLHFAKMQTDAVVLEVGLGGRLDATNVVDPVLAVITPISLEHTQVLGDSLSAIAGEKAGIIKRGTEVVVGPQPSEALEAILDTCRIMQANPILVQENVRWKIEKAGLDGQLIRICGKDNLTIKLSLLGEWQGENAAIAFMAAQSLQEKGFHIDKEIVRQGFAAAKWPGRFEVVSDNPIIILDGAHNPAGACALAQSLKFYFSGKEIILILGVLKDKDLTGIVEPLAAVATEVIVVPVDNERARTVDEVVSVVRKHCRRVSTRHDVVSAVEELSKEKSEKIICICGSLYLVGEIKRFFDGNTQRGR